MPNEFIEFRNISNKAVVLEYWNTDYSQQRRRVVKPSDQIIISTSTGSAELTLFFRTEDEHMYRETWKEFWREHEMPEDICLLGGFKKTKYGDGNYSYMESLYIEELVSVTRNDDGIFVFKTV
jgi:hypothetical protein